MPERIAVYAGSFDPPTLGHMYVIREGARLFDRVIVAVAGNPEKECTFPVQERVDLLKKCTEGMEGVSVESFGGRFLAEYAASVGATHLLRGARNETDFVYERTMRNVNEDIQPGLTTVLLIPPRELADVSSEFVRGLVGLEGWRDVVARYLPEPVIAAFERHTGGR